MVKVGIVESSQYKECAIIQCDEAFVLPVNQRSNYRELFEKIDRNAIFVVAEEEEILGYAAMYCNDMERLEAYITLIAVRPEAQGKQIGTRILSMCENIAIQKGMKTIRLEVSKMNSKAIAFYQKNGFEDIKQQGEESIYMRKIL